MNTQAIILAAVAAASFSGGWLGNGWRLGEQHNADRVEQSKAAFRALEAANAETTRIQEAKDHAIEQAQAQAQANAATARAARAERDRLRDDLAANRAAIANASPASLVAHAETLTVVFEQCTREYSELAEKADGHALDASTLFDAWKGIAAK